jgi:inosine-uridine nucleoside N-ribohydrolase
MSDEQRRQKNESRARFLFTGNPIRINRQNMEHLNRRGFLNRLAILGTAASLPGVSGGWAAAVASKPQPVILATDIGDDIDDTWALGFLLKCPELDVKLAVGEYGKRNYRAKLLGKLLQSMGRGEIPIGMGMDDEPRGDGPQAAWVKDYDLGNYQGKVHQDGVQAIIDTVMRSRQPVTIIAIGPMPNLAVALQREPRIAQKARLVGMYGSVRKGYGGSKTPSPEWNVKADPKACQSGLAAPWPITITPLDTCGMVTLEGEQYRRVLASKNLVASTIMENYRIWSKANKAPEDVAQTRSSVLFDTVAVYLAFSQAFCTMERLGIRVAADGATIIDPQAKQMEVATDWKNLNGFREFLVERLTK